MEGVPAPGVGVWGSTNLKSKPEECSSSTEREARSVALEKAYVHDVYQQIAVHFSDSRYRAWPRVKQFLLDLEPGSFVCDVGCGNGKYLSINPSIYKIGLDRCSNLANIAREKEHEVMICDNLALPFRDECFDAGLSIAVIHHFATTERRVAALKELARVLRIGGKLMVSVWAMEQRHRKFESQDVLVPWNRPMTSSSDDKTSSIERDLNSTTTTTSDDDATHYHAYTQTSDSDSFHSLSGVRKRGRVRHRGRSIDPTCPSSSQSSSDLSSPNESCYSFVRRALQKLAGTRRNRGGRRPWFLQGLDIAASEDIPAAEQFAYIDDDIGDCMDYHHHHHHHHHHYHHHHHHHRNQQEGCCPERGAAIANGGPGGATAAVAGAENNFIPIELRQLESTEYAELFQSSDPAPLNPGTALGGLSKATRASLLFSNVLYPRRRRTLETACGDMGPSASQIGVQPKSKSLSDLLGLLPVGLLRSSPQRKSNENVEERKNRHRGTGTCGGNEGGHSSHHRAHRSLSPLVQSYEDVTGGIHRRHVSVQTESLESLDSSTHSSVHCPSKGSGESSLKRKPRPLLVKQKHSICSDPEEEPEGEGKKENGQGRGEGAKSGRDLSLDLSSHEHLDLVPDKLSPPTRRDVSEENKGGDNRGEPGSSKKGSKLKHQKKSIGGSVPFWKQTSMNDELIFSAGSRLREKERLKQQVQKQCSLQEELIYKGARGSGVAGGITTAVENTRWDQMKEAFLKNSSNVKCFQLIKNGLSGRFRSTTESSSGSASGGHLPGSTTPSGSGGGEGASTPGGVSSSNGENGSGASLLPPHGGTTNGNSGASEGGQQSATQGGGDSSCSSHTTAPPRGGVGSQGSSLRNGIVRMLQNWKQGEDQYASGGAGGHGRYSNTGGATSATSSARRALFPPFFLRRSSAGSLTLGNKGVNKDHHHHLGHHIGQCPSPGPLSPLGKVHSGEGVEGNGATNGGASGNKLLPGVRHVRKLSREDGSDSSKDSSFQSDTSVDSEDSFASVIFIPKSMDDFGAGGGDFGTRANSTDSDRSPKSPASRLSPPNHSHGNLPKSPSPLAQEVLVRKKSPEVSPDPGRPYRLAPGGSGPGSGVGGGGGSEVTKFLFDETVTTRLLGQIDEGVGNQEQEQDVGIHLEPETNGEKIVQAEMMQVKEEEGKEAISPTRKREELNNIQVSSPSPSPPPVIVIPPRVSGKKMRVEKIEVLRKPGVAPEGKSGYTRQLVRRSLPKALAVELFNPETDDADTSDTSSSSPNSVSSVVSVVNEDNASSGPMSTLDELDEQKRPITQDVDEVEELEVDEDGGPLLLPDFPQSIPKKELAPPVADVEEGSAVEIVTTRRKSSSSGILEVAASVVSSLESLVSQSTSPKARRKITLARLGSTSEWLSSLDMGVTGGDVAPASKKGFSSKSSSLVKKGSQRGSTEAKWPPMIMDDEVLPMEMELTEENNRKYGGVTTTLTEASCLQEACSVSAAKDMSGGLSVEEMLEERDSLFDSMENLTGTSKQQPSRNPSIDSSVRMSSTCSCSIRGGDSFDSWTSAKSSMTNSSSTQPKTSLPSVIPSEGRSNPLSVASSNMNSSSSASNNGPGSSQGAKLSSSLDGTKAGIQGGGASVARRREAQSRIRVQSSSKSSSQAGEDTEDSTALTCHRYYHVFREGELDKLIEKYVQNLHIISSYYDHANWCIIAEKVQVWTI